MKTCARCQKKLDIFTRISFSARCPFCRHALHVCLNCRFYDASRSPGCREPEAEKPRSPEEANFCEYFLFREKEEVARKDSEKAKEEFEKLFRNFEEEEE